MQTEVSMPDERLLDFIADCFAQKMLKAVYDEGAQHKSEAAQVLLMGASVSPLRFTTFEPMRGGTMTGLISGT